jgi:hypothetical protein
VQQAGNLSIRGLEFHQRNIFIGHPLTVRTLVAICTDRVSQH